MEKTGSINKLVTLANKYDIKHAKTEELPQIRSNRKTLMEMLSIAEDIGKSKNLNDILNMERILLRSELSRCTDTAVDKGRVTSLTNAIDDLNKAANGLELVNDRDKYKESSKIISSHDIDRKNGIPRDKVHRFIDSHITRLNNNLIFSGNSFEEKLLTKERVSNMSILKKEYMKLQAKALDIPIPEKSREIEK